MKKEDISILLKSGHFYLGLTPPKTKDRAYFTGISKV